MKIPSILLRLLALVALLGATGCKVKSREHSVLSANSGERSVRVDSEGQATLQSGPILSVINLDGREITIEKERLLINGKEVATFPPTAKAFEVTVADGKIKVTADGAEIIATMLR